jgi:hypothetical protein
MRDEEANLVWATERLITLGDGTQIRNGDDSGTGAREPTTETRPQFRLRSDVPGYFVLCSALSISQRRQARYICVEHGRSKRQALQRLNTAAAWSQNRGDSMKRKCRGPVRVRRTHAMHAAVTVTGISGSADCKQTAPRTHAPVAVRFLEEPPA